MSIHFRTAKMSAEEYESCASYLLSKTKTRPIVGIICGSGLSGLSKSLQNPETFRYEDIPSFPRATVPGHAGELVFGTLGSAGVQCVCMRGRFHFYEGNDMSKVTLPVRVMRLLGVKLLIVTNAAGGLNTEYNVGDIMVIQDHLGLPCLAGNNPLVGINNDMFGPRFPAMSDAYDPVLQDMVMDIAKTHKLDYKVRVDGTYCFVSGPCYESKLECRFLQAIGGDSVGMSTVPEVIVAKHCGMKVLGFSLITNKVVTNKTQTQHASHEEVLEVVQSSGQHVELLVRSLLSYSPMIKFLGDLPAVSYTMGKQPKLAATSAAAPATGSRSGSLLDTVVTLVGVGAIIVGLYTVMKSRN